MKLETKHILGFIFLILSFISLFEAVMYFYIGYNNTDLIFNYQNFALEINPYLIEYNISINNIYQAKDNMSNNEIKTLNEVYKLGVKQSRLGFIFMFISGLLFVSGIYYLIQNDF